VLEGGVTDVVLLDVTPLSLGIETMGNIFTRLIPRNTSIPFKKSQTFSTAADGQTEVEIKVLQGEREIASQNKKLGSFNLVGIMPAPKGVPKIEVTFDIDANGIVHVSAKDTATGKEQQIRVQSSGGLTEEQIKQMIEDARLHEDEDRKAKEAADAVNLAEGVLYQLEKELTEHQANLPAPEVEALRNQMQELRELVNKRDDPQQIKSKAEEVRNASFKVFEPLYKKQDQSQSQQQSNPDDQSNPKDSETK